MTGLVGHGYGRAEVLSLPLPQLWLEYDAIQWRAFVDNYDEFMAEVNAALNRPKPARRDSEGHAERAKLRNLKAERIEKFMQRSDRFWFGAAESKRRADLREQQQAKGARRG